MNFILLLMTSSCDLCTQSFDLAKEIYSSQKDSPLILDSLKEICLGNNQCKTMINSNQEIIFTYFKHDYPTEPLCQILNFCPSNLQLRPGNSCEICQNTHYNVNSLFQYSDKENYRRLIKNQICNAYSDQHAYRTCNQFTQSVAFDELIKLNSKTACQLAAQCPGTLQFVSECQLCKVFSNFKNQQSLLNLGCNLVNFKQRNACQQYLNLWQNEIIEKGDMACQCTTKEKSYTIESNSTIESNISKSLSNWQQNVQSSKQLANDLSNAIKENIQKYSYHYNYNYNQKKSINKSDETATIEKIKKFQFWQFFACVFMVKKYINHLKKMKIIRELQQEKKVKAQQLQLAAMQQQQLNQQKINKADITMDKNTYIPKSSHKVINTQDNDQQQQQLTHLTVEQQKQQLKQQRKDVKNQKKILRESKRLMKEQMSMQKEQDRINYQARKIKQQQQYEKFTHKYNGSHHNNFIMFMKFLFYMRNFQNFQYEQKNQNNEFDNQQQQQEKQPNNDEHRMQLTKKQQPKRLCCCWPLSILFQLYQFVVYLINYKKNVAINKYQATNEQVTQKQKNNQDNNQQKPIKDERNSSPFNFEVTSEKEPMKVTANKPYVTELD